MPETFKSGLQRKKDTVAKHHLFVVYAQSAYYFHVASLYF